MKRLIKSKKQKQVVALRNEKNKTNEKRKREYRIEISEGVLSSDGRSSPINGGGNSLGDIVDTHSAVTLFHCLLFNSNNNKANSAMLSWILFQQQVSSLLGFALGFTVCFT